MSDVRVVLLSLDRGPVEPHADRGWPEFTITVRYMVKTDDPALGDAAARAMFDGFHCPVFREVEVHDAS